MRYYASVKNLKQLVVEEINNNTNFKVIDMEDELIITYDNDPPDIPTLIVARKDKYDMTMLKKIQGDEAFEFIVILLVEQI